MNCNHEWAQRQPVIIEGETICLRCDRVRVPEYVAEVQQRDPFYKKRDRVKVYQQYLTNEGCEGRARLISYLGYKTCGAKAYEQWRVRFLTDGEPIVTRWVEVPVDEII